MKSYVKSILSFFVILFCFANNAFSQYEDPPDENDFVIKISTVQDITLGSTFEVPVTLISAPPGLALYDLQINYDHNLITLLDVIPSDAFYSDSGCAWNHFVYKTGQDTINAEEDYIASFVNVHSEAQTSSNPENPNCYTPDTPAEMFRLRFLMTGDQNFTCELIPIRFYWSNCADNVLLYWFFDSTSGYVPRVATAWQVDRVIHPDFPADTFPSFDGVGYSCLTSFPEEYHARRRTYFYNGGISTECDSTPILIGDVNRNFVAYEKNDAIMFQNYFEYGESIFVKSPDEQIAATDINRDGETLKLEDFTQLNNIVKRGSHPDSTIDSTLSGSVIFNDQTSKTVSLSSDYVSDLIWIMMTGEIFPRSSIDISVFHKRYDGTFTRLTLSKFNGFGPGGLELFTYTGEGEIVVAQATTEEGIEIALRIDDVATAIEEPDDILPSVFALHQNYPNPFNIETVIEFDMPNASEVSFEIINILGQVVYNVTNRYSAGSHTIYWDGSSNSGQTVGSGVYYYRITAGDFVSSKKMILLK